MSQSHNIVASEAHLPRWRHAPAHGALRRFTARPGLGLHLAVAFGAGLCAAAAFVWSVS